MLVTAFFLECINSTDHHKARTSRAVSLLTCSSKPDSAGTHFIFGYIRDADRNISNQLLSVTVLKSNNYDCLFSVQYREDYDETKNPLVTEHFNVPAMNMTEVPIPSWYGWMYDSGGMQDNKGPWQLISANSSCPVTLIANNHDNATLQEDSYLVLPTKWAKYGQVYAFTLPPASSDVNQNQHISIIPMERDVKGVLKVGSNSFAFTAKLVGPTAYFMTKTPNSQPMTYKIEADGPILPDSAGTKFIFGYIRDANRDISNQVLSVTVPVYTSPATTTSGSSTSAPSSKPSTNIPSPSSTPRKQLTTSTAIPTSAQTSQSSSTQTTTKSSAPTQKTSTILPVTTTRSSAPPLQTSTILPATTSSSYSFSSFFLAILITCLRLLL